MGQCSLKNGTNFKSQRTYLIFASIEVLVLILLVIIFNVNDNFKVKYYEFTKDDNYMMSYIQKNSGSMKNKTQVVECIDKVARDKTSAGLYYLENIFSKNRSVPDYIYEEILKSFNKYNIKFKDSKVLCNYIYMNNITNGRIKDELLKQLNKYDSNAVQDDCIRCLKNIFENGKIIEGIDLIRKYKSIGIGRFGRIYDTKVPIDKLCSFYFLQNYSDAYKNDLKNMLLKYPESSIDAQVSDMINGFYDEGNTESIKHIINVYSNDVIGKNEKLIKLDYLYKNEDENNKQIDKLYSILKSSDDLDSEESLENVRKINTYKSQNSQIENDAEEILKNI